MIDLREAGNIAILHHLLTHDENGKPTLTPLTLSDIVLFIAPNVDIGWVNIFEGGITIVSDKGIAYRLIKDGILQKEKWFPPEEGLSLFSTLGTKMLALYKRGDMVFIGTPWTDVPNIEDYL